jgi:hypothetical protein
MVTTLSLRRLWTIYKRTAVQRGLSKRDLASTQLAFYSGARGVLKVLAYLIEHGDYEELRDTIKRQGRQIERLRSQRPRARSH